MLSGRQRPLGAGARAAAPFPRASGSGHPSPWRARAAVQRSSRSGVTGRRLEPAPRRQASFFCGAGLSPGPLPLTIFPDLYLPVFWRQGLTKAGLNLALLPCRPPGLLGSQCGHHTQLCPVFTLLSSAQGCPEPPGALGACLGGPVRRAPGEPAEPGALGQAGVSQSPVPGSCAHGHQLRSRRDCLVTSLCPERNQSPAFPVESGFSCWHRTQRHSPEGT